MCGRFTLQHDPGEIAAHFGLDETPGLAARANIAPGQDVAVVREAGPESTPQRRVLEMRRWGLVPGWARDPGIGARLVNARAETAAAKPAFRSALRRRRCLVPADGFYEWKGVRGERRPFHVALPKGGLFAIAGLYEHWEDAEGTPLETVTLLTRAANARLQALHGRMPVLVEPDDYACWLGAPVARAAKLLEQAHSPLAAALEIRPVSSYVNDVRNEGPACLAPPETPPLALEDF